MSERAALIEDFLARHGWAGAARRPLAGDASFRRYERLSNAAGSSIVLMDAPPPHEDVRPYLALARHLVSIGLSAPRVYAADETVGLLLIEDLGDANMAALVGRAEDAAALYVLALDTLIALHRHPRARAIAVPAYDDARMLSEAMVLLDWYLPSLTGAPVPEGVRADYRARWQAVLPRARSVPESLVLRDFFPDNLMLLRDRAGIAACGLLDFQDAVIGPVTYDLVSLLEDARREVPAELQATLIARYLAAFPALERQAFAASYAIMGAQRNLRILGVFTRLCMRDGKPWYLDHIPRIWRLIERDTAHPALEPVREWLARQLPQEMRRAPAREAVR
ncbi:MAG: aminoglycoside phosphotransferase family protein [Alphaproteobacteria bacterium]